MKSRSSFWFLARSSLCIVALTLPSHSHASPTDSLRAVADSLSTAGDYRGAHDALVTIRERVGASEGVRSIAYAHEGVELGGVRMQLGLLDEANDVLLTSLAIYRDSVDSYDTRLANCLDKLGTVTHYRGLNQEALPIFEEAIAIFESSGPDTSLAGSLNNYSLVTRLLRMTDEATDAARRALAILMRDVPDHRGIPYVLNNLANLHVDQGDYATAEPLYRESIARRRTLFGPSHPQVATALSNLAHVMRFQGNQREAEALLREVWEIRKGVNEWHPDVGRSMMNLANCLREQGRYDEAGALLAGALDIHAETLGEEHPSFARNLGYLADLHFAKGDFTTARDYFERTLAKNRVLIAPEHPHIAANMSMIARCADGLGAPDTDSLYRAGTAAWEERAGARHASTIASRIHYARYLLANDRPADALIILEVVEPHYETARLKLQPGPKRSRFTEAPYRTVAEAHLALGNHGDAWDAWERANGRVFFDLLYEANGFPWTADERTELARLNLAWDELEKRVATLNEGLKSDVSLRGARDQAQSELYRAEAGYLTYRNQLAALYGGAEPEPLNWRETQARLPSDVAVICWIDPRPGDEGDAWVSILRNHGEPVWRRVERGRTITGAWATRAWSELLARTGDWPFRVTDAGKSDALATKIRAERVAPIEDLLGGVRHLVIIPGRAMSRVPCEALARADGSVLGEEFSISYAASGTTFLTLSDRSAAPGRAALLVGDPVLGRGTAAAGQSDGAADGVLVASLASDIVPRALAGDPTALLALPPLPASREEIDAIQSALGNGTALVGADATEERLRELAENDQLRDFRWIHFATHTLIDDRNADGSLIVLSQRELADPLASALSGATRTDGLLSAREIIRDWRLDADLVSLSSCRSALGVESPGDGFLGLSQAFFYAGARSVVVSLWSVDDRASSILMGAFYQNLAAGHARSQALWRAKQALRAHEERGVHPYQHPAYWSAFVLHGSP